MAGSVQESEVFVGIRGIDHSNTSGFEIVPPDPSKVSGEWGPLAVSEACRDCPVLEVILSDNDASARGEVYPPKPKVGLHWLTNRGRDIVTRANSYFLRDDVVVKPELDGSNCREPRQGIVTGGRIACRATLQDSSEVDGFPSVVLLESKDGKTRVTTKPGHDPRRIISEARGVDRWHRSRYSLTRVYARYVADGLPSQLIVQSYEEFHDGFVDQGSPVQDPIDLAVQISNASW